ncbi:MAG TPA: methyltransferase domain-containing protein [Myxococcota bacterium]
MSDAWDPGQYEKFREERAQPFYDLVKLVIPKRAMRVVDLGCGTGELTRELHRHVKAASTIGVDSSSAMLERTQEVASEPGLSFAQGALESWSPPGSDVDLLFSNAALHWVPDHPAFIARAFAMLSVGGQLAVQMPANQDHASHVVAEELAREAPFVDALHGVAARQTVLPVEQYAVLLLRAGFRAQNVRTQVYVHRLPNKGGVVEWVKGAMLTDLKRRMSDALYAQFLEAYRERLLARLSDEPSSRSTQAPYLYTFKRVLFVAEK